jgi:hypothetical protein
MAGQTKMGQFLKSRGSNQNEAAEAIGVSTTSFSGKSNGKRPFKQWEIKKLAERYNMTAQELYDVFFG